MFHWGKQARKATVKETCSRARLQFPVGCVHCLLRKGNYAERVEAGRSIYLAGNAARNSKESLIISCHLHLIIHNNKDFCLIILFV
ncbi:PREDICTED: histone H2A-like [Gekko japonicus]|uniref:Histone H2A n=1 Tax=Gekko japonicus TaxID=146911 RepID=A0ABM1JLR2_GEKJA|nr:PREDICTED: histone H2A-like [Gekko japonicus]